MESHGTKRAYRAQCLEMKRQRYIGMCPSSLRSHRKMELRSLRYCTRQRNQHLDSTRRHSLPSRQNCGSSQRKTNKIHRTTRIKREYKGTSVYQINIVFDFLGGHHEQLRNDLRSITNTDKELSYLIERCQKWILSQNVNIVKKFYDFF